MIDTLERDPTGVLHIVALSGGKDSTAMALRLAELHQETGTKAPLHFVCTPTGDELPAMFQHFARLRELLGKPILPIPKHSLNGLIEHYGALPNWWMRWCTRRIKIEPYLEMLVAAAPAVSYVGLRADEEARSGLEVEAKDIEVRHPLREWGWGRVDVERYLVTRGVKVPPRTDCARCFFQTIGEWWLLWKDHPDIYADAEAQEIATGHTFRSAQRDSWPAALRDLRLIFESGAAPRGANQGNLFASDNVRRQTCRTCTL